MELEFRLNGTQIYPIVNSTINERVGTFSDGTLPLELNNVESAFLPMSSLTITDTSTNSVWNFVVVADDVERVNKVKPFLYRHNLTIRSGIYQATKHLLRNTIFSQPPRKMKSTFNQLVAFNGAYLSSTPFFYPETESGKQNYVSTSIKLNSRSKISRAIVRCETEIWSYANSSDRSTPVAHDINSHHSIAATIRRYDDGVYAGSQSIDFMSGATEFNPTVNDPMWRNISNNTELEVILNISSGCKFNPSSNSYAGGAIAIVRLTLEIETYYYSMFDICDILYKQSKKEYNYDSTNELPFLEMTDTDKKNELKSIIAPEISFNGSTYYDALYQLLSYIDAVPVVDSNNHLSFEYLNNYDANNIIDVDNQRADERKSINDEYYTNKLVTTYQNARQENAITYPSGKKFVRVNTKSVGIPNQADYILKTQKPIDYVESVILKTGSLYFDIDFYWTDNGSHYDITYGGITVTKLDVANRVLEISAYESLNDNREYYDETFLLCNCLCYTRGTDYIDLLNKSALTYLSHEIYKYVIMAELKFYFGVPSDSLIAKYDGDKVVDIPTNVEGQIAKKQELYYQITYYGLFDGRVEQASPINRYDGETYANQENAQASLNRMGNNLQGLIAKVGNETDNVTFDVSSYGSRVKVGSIWVTDDNEKYIANVVQTTFSTDLNKVIVNAQFTKNFNLLSQYTKIDQQKRFYEISNQLTSKGYENITEYIYFCYEDRKLGTLLVNYLASAIKNISTEPFLRTLIFDTLNGTRTYNYTVDYATFRPITYESEYNFAINKYIYLPIHTYGCGNSICFEMDFDSVINSMNHLVGDGNGDNPHYTKTALYTEKNGFADKMEIKIVNESLSVNYSEDFPYIDNVDGDSVIQLDDLHYYKKPNEIFHLNYALAFLSANENEFFFGDRFINNNAIIPNAILSHQVKFYYGNNIYSIIDNKNLNSNTVSHTLAVINDTESGAKFLEVTISLQSPITCKSWALVDENNNVLIASNKEFTNETEIIFYVIPRRNRI